MVAANNDGLGVPVGRLDARWRERYAQLLDFQARTGRLPRESGKDLLIGETAVAGWLRYQRRRALRGSMPAWQRGLLSQVPEFSWRPSTDQWQQHYRRLRRFLQVEGRVPRYRSAIASERELAGWVSKQRHLYRRGRLSSERVTALRRLPFRIV